MKKEELDFYSVTEENLEEYIKHLRNYLQVNGYPPASKEQVEKWRTQLLSLIESKKTLNLMNKMLEGIGNETNRQTQLD